MARYLIIRALDPLDCFLRFLEEYKMVGFASLYEKPVLVGIYDDVLVVGIPRDLLRKARAIISLADNCHTVKVSGTSNKAKRIALSIRRRSV